MRNVRTRSIALLGVLALVIAACGSGATETAEGSSEGIQVHGDWTIEVLNPDGTLDQHVEFSNALLPTGADALVRILAALSTSGGAWNIVLTGVSQEHACETGGVAEPCLITAVQEDFFPDQGKILLNGSITAEIDGNIGRVGTRLLIATPVTEFIDFSESDYRDADGNTISVSAGQTVQVTVEISFS